MVDRCEGGIPITDEPCPECGATGDDLCGAVTGKVNKPGVYAAGLRAKLGQIATVCDDNSAPTCDAHMALKFIRQIAAA